MSYLSLGGLLKDEYADWLVDVNLPKKLMGGPFNEGNEVKLKDVRKCHSWADGESDDADSFVPFKIYDPILISEWINEIYADPESQEKYRALPLTLNKARGIMIDCRDVPAPMNDSIFSTRENPSVFIEYYQEKIGARE